MEYNCRGGPMHGKMLVRREGRGSKGVLLVDRPENHCWIYDWDEESRTFASRQEEPMRVLTEGLDNRYRAAEEDEYDVVAAPWVVSPE